MKRHVLSATLLVLAAVHSAAPQVFLPYEAPIESTASYLTLPASVPGQLIARGCEGCKGVELKVTASTRFFMREEQVALEEFRKYAYGATPVGVYYLPESREVTRVVLIRDRPRQAGDVAR